MRLDQYLAKELQTRTRAADAIKQGRVSIAGKTITKPAYELKEEEQDQIEIRPVEHDYVSRAGGKLQAAFDAFHIDVKDQCVLDIGASTGGFTQCVLEHGARKVYALDVGHLQLSPALKADSRVVEMEGMNARSILKSWFSDKIDFICMDVSFISALSILEPLFLQMMPEHLCVLVKPQFECTKNALNKKGVIKNPKYEAQAVEKIQNALLMHYAKVRKIPSPVVGRSGNQEYLLYACRPKEIHSAPEPTDAPAKPE
ncbi:TlyA family RNA methyltransferase [Allobaculum fili]|uniref:TlyA family RNA methyltransferase n=1 Tax=Allobaculum fili TaxID=2834460 RepID=UPI001E62B5C8|nr:TlyA family RNA methyltransferase [Allobaculum fili]